MLLKSAMKILKQHQDELTEQGVRTLAIFGSVARNEGGAESDLDILIDFDSKRGLFAFVGLKTYLEKVLNCEVDLVTKNALHPALKPKILREAKHVF
jgi:predicted nucleotidyltransferase